MIVSAIGVLIGMVVVIAGAAKVVQLTGWRPTSHVGRTLVLQESIALDPRRRIHLIQCGQRQVVVLTGGGQDLVIGWMPDT